MARNGRIAPDRYPMASDTSPDDPKAELRARNITKRRQLDGRERRRLDHRICNHLLEFLDGRDFVRIAAYSAFKGEPDLLAALEALHRTGRSIHLPVLEGGNMTFRRWQPGAPMETSRLGIPEPVDGTVCPPEELELVLVPLVAFSADGTRLGMGAGYYDRTFGFRLDQDDAGPMLIGAAYSLQEADRLPVDRWDVPLDGVITEDGLRWFG